MQLLILGLDGATFEQLLPRIKAGEMPTLRRLLDAGIWGPLASTQPPVTAPAWSTFFTGLNPGRHGVFGFVEFEADSEGKLHPILNNLSTIRGHRLWNYLNRHKLKVGLSNVPMTYPAEPVDGFMVSDLMTSGRHKATTYPATLKEELLSNTHISFDRAVMDGLSETSEYLEHLIQSLETQEQVDLYLMQTRPVDVFVTVYAHTDTLQHYFWKYLDSSHPEHDPAKAKDLSPLFETFFHRLDRVIANLWEAAGSETPLLIISDHGFGPVNRMVFVNRWLQAQGYLVLAEKADSLWRTALLRMGLTPTAVKKWLKRADFLGLRHRLSKEMRHKLRDTIGHAFRANLDLRRTLAYARANADQGIYINRQADLNPDGLEFTDQAYEQLRDELMSGLSSLRDPATGESVFEWIARREDVYSGQYVFKAPDIVFQPARGYFVSAEVGGRDQSIVTPRQGIEITGFHRPDGVFVAYGPNFKSGHIKDARIVDIVPTTLHVLGLPIPSHLDGQVLDIVPSTYAKPVYFEEVPPEEVAVTEYSGEEEAEIINRLRDLGYL